MHMFKGSSIKTIKMKERCSGSSGFLITIEKYLAVHVVV